MTEKGTGVILLDYGSVLEMFKNLLTLFWSWWTDDALISTGWWWLVVSPRGSVINCFYFFEIAGC